MQQYEEQVVFPFESVVHDWHVMQQYGWQQLTSFCVLVATTPFQCSTSLDLLQSAMA
jgi:hypothetical protein